MSDQQCMMSEQRHSCPDICPGNKILLFRALISPAQLNITRSAQLNITRSTQLNITRTAQLNITRSTQLNITRSAQLNITRSAQLNITRSAQLNITRLAKHLPQLYQCVPSKRNEGSIVCHCLWEHPVKT